MNTRRPLSVAMVVLCGGIFTLISPPFSWSGTGATVAGGSIGGGMILPNCGSGTVNISGGKAGNQTIGVSAGCNASFDALAWFQRPSPYTLSIPPGWQNTPGSISDCSSPLEAPPAVGSVFAMLAYDLNGQVLVNIVVPNPGPQMCARGGCVQGRTHQYMGSSRPSCRQCQCPNMGAYSQAYNH